MTALGAMYETGVLVAGPTMGDAFFRKRMGYNNPNKQATALVAEARYGNQGKWRGETFDKRPLVAGVHSGEPPGMDVMTVIYQERAMDPKWPAAPTNRMDMINPSWQQNVSAYGGHTGTVEMLASGHRAILPMANDSLEQISANAIDENKRLAIHDPLSNFYAAKTLGVTETLANARVADRLAEHNAKQTALKSDQVIVDSDGRVLSRENRKGMRKPHAVIMGMRTPADNMSLQSNWIQRKSKGGIHQVIKQDHHAITLQNQGGGGGGGSGGYLYPDGISLDGPSPGGSGVVGSGGIREGVHSHGSSRNSDTPSMQHLRKVVGTLSIAHGIMSPNSGSGSGSSGVRGVDAETDTREFRGGGLPETPTTVPPEPNVIFSQKIVRRYPQRIKRETKGK